MIDGDIVIAQVKRKMVQFCRRGLIDAHKNNLERFQFFHTVKASKWGSSVIKIAYMAASIHVFYDPTDLILWYFCLQTIDQVPSFDDNCIKNTFFLWRFCDYVSRPCFVITYSKIRTKVVVKKGGYCTRWANNLHRLSTIIVRFSTFSLYL